MLFILCNIVQAKLKKIGTLFGVSDQKVRQASPFTAGKDSTAGGAGSLEFSTEKRVLRFHFCCAIHMYGSGKNQANTLGRGAPEVAFGEDIRPEAIPATSMN